MPWPKSWQWSFHVACSDSSAPVDPVEKKTLGLSQVSKFVLDPDWMNVRWGLYECSMRIPNKVEVYNGLLERFFPYILFSFIGSILWIQPWLLQDHEEASAWPGFICQIWLLWRLSWHGIIRVGCHHLSVDVQDPCAAQQMELTISCDAAIMDFQILPVVSSRFVCGLTRAALAMKPQVDLALRRMAAMGVPKES